MTTATQENQILEQVPKQLLIGGEWRDGSGGGTLPVEDPATGDTLCEVADAQPEDSLAALAAATEAQEEWGAHPPRERGDGPARAFAALGGPGAREAGGCVFNRSPFFWPLVTSY